MYFRPSTKEVRRYKSLVGSSKNCQHRLIETIHMATERDLLSIHGWTAVPRDPNVILAGRPYIHSPSPLLVKDIAFPSEDAIVAKAQQYAQEKLPPQTFNHSMRVFYFGMQS